MTRDKMRHGTKEETMDYWRFAAKLLCQSSGALVRHYLHKKLGPLVCNRMRRDLISKICWHRLKYSFAGLPVHLPEVSDPKIYSSPYFREPSRLE